ncbi:MAG: sigma-70 family RNA polymerase sigma factor [Planctomycetes bacterium]|nr:sigma-70 family RNA polymerase sigma factor [Planctomycetota bacterium]
MTNSRPLDPEALLAEAAWVRALARSLVRGDEVDDLVQDTWTAALERRPDVETAGGLRAWLGRVTRNLAIDRRRVASAQAWHAKRLERHDPERPDDAVARIALQQKLVAAVLALDEPHRSAVIWRYLDGLDSDEIARRQGVTPEAARKRISRGLATLRERFDREHRGGRAEWLALFACVAEPPQVLVRSYLAWKVIAALVVASLAGGRWWVSASSPSRAPTTAATPSLVSATPEPFAVAPTPDPNARVATGSALAAPNAPSAQATLRGRVLDADGAPKAGARVDVFTSDFAGFQLIDKAAQRARELVATLTTDAGGEFTFAAAALDRLYDLEAGADGVRAAPLFDVSAGMDVTLELRPMGSLYGRVVRLERAEPLAGVRVEATFRPDRITHTRALAVATTTDEQGVYRFASLSPGPYTLRVELADAPSVSSSVTVWPGESTARNLVVESGRTVRGRVVDAPTSAPIVGALVSDFSSFTRAVATDAHGEFVLDGIPPRRDAMLRARAPGYGVSTIRVAQGVEPVLVPMQRASTWRGRVVDELGAPLSDAYVAAVAHEVLEADRGRGVQQSDRVVTRTDAQGAFELVDVRTDVTHWLFARKPGFGTRWIAVPKEPQNDRDLPDVVLEASAAIAVRVIDEHGAPVAGAWVWIRGVASSSAENAPPPAMLERLGVREVRTAADGSARVADLARDSYEVKASLRPGGALAIENVVLSAPGEVQDLELELARGRAIRGRVVDGAGRPLDAIVTLEQAELGTWSRAERILSSESIPTDSDGRFEFEILGSHECRLAVFPQETDANGEPLYSPKSLGAVEPGGKPLEVRLEASVRVSGRVLDADGVPVASCVVRLDREGAFASGVDYVETDATGGFRLLLAPTDLVVIRAEWPARFNQPPYASGLRRVVVETPVPAPDGLEIRFAWRVADGAPDGGGK